MSEKKKKTRHLTVLLLKEHFSKYDKALKDIDQLTEHALSTSLPFKGAVFVQDRHSRPPGWVKFLNEGVNEPIDDIFNASGSALLFVKSNKRVFAVTFGYGRNLLKPESFERDFGLRIALNTVDPDELRSVDARTVEELTVHTRRDTSRGATFDSFSLDAGQDFLRSLSGKPLDEEFATRVTGSDAVALGVQVEFKELGDLCAKLYAAYIDDAYKKNGFGFIDYVRRLKDPEIITKLEGLLLEDLRRGSVEKMHLAAPEPMEWERVEGFTYTASNHSTDFPDLDIDDFRDSYSGIASVTIETLKSTHIGILYADSSQSVKRWSVYSALAYEGELEGKVYVLSGGDWFEIEKAFAKKVGNAIKALAKNSPVLQSSTLTESESDYNKRVAAARQYTLMDRACVRAGGNPIEVCDLFSSNGEFIHVKRKTRSATLSHLFAQGVVSAEIFISDGEFRRDIRDTFGHGSNMVARLIPTTRPDPAKYRIVFAIIRKPTSKWPLSLPFFSQLNLKNAAERLARLGFEVSLTGVDAFDA